jgi:hypothetical protein
MTTPNPHHDDGGTTPPPSTPEVLFTLWANAGVQAVGTPTSPGSGRLKIEITPTQMIRLQQELSNRAIIALMLVLEHGTRGAGQRVEIEGWSARWLIERGMARTTAEKAARELSDKGYIRSERMPGNNSPLGKKLGVVPPAAINFEAEDEVGIPRTDGRRRRLQSVTAPDASSAESRNAAGPVEEDVENAVPADRGNGVSADRRRGDNTDVFPQVSAVSAKTLNGLSTAPTSSGSTEEDLFFLSGHGQALTRSDLTRFFAQSALIEAVAARWEVTVALVAREFAPHASRCAEVIDWLGEAPDEHPETRLAQIVVDLVKTVTLERFQAASAQEAFLRARGVKFRQTTPDDFIATFVVSMVTALDSTRPIESWGGWFGGAFKRDSQFQGKVTGGVLGVFRQLLEDPNVLTPAGAPATSGTAGGTTYEEDDPSYVERLRVAAQGTNWEDEISFQTLLRNAGAQARLLAHYAQRSARHQ